MQDDRLTHSPAHRMAGWLFDRRGRCLAACLVLTACMAGPALHVGVDNSVGVWFTEGDPALAAYRDFQETFGNDEAVLVALRRPEGMLTPEGFCLLRETAQALAAVEGVAEVTSLATMETPQRHLLGVRLVPLLPSGAVSAEQAARLRSRILSDTTRYGRLVNAEGTVAVLLVRMAPNEEIDARRPAILEEIDQVLAQSGAEYHTAGTGVILTALNRAALRDSWRLIMGANLLIFFLLWSLFRRAAPVLLILGVVAMATVWMLGALGLAGRSLNTVTLVLPTLVLVISTTACVHFLLQNGPPVSKGPRDHVVQRLGCLLQPCAANALTTAAGFASLTVSQMPVVRDLGLFAALGVLGGFVAAVAGSTWLLAQGREIEGETKSGGRLRFFEKLGAVGLQFPRPVLAATGALVVLAGAGLARLTVDTDTIGYLPADHPARQDSDFIEAAFGAYMPLEFVVEGPDTLLRAGVLEVVADWQARAVATGAVSWSRSGVDALRLLHAALPGGSATIPERPGKLEGLVQLGRTSADPSLQELAAHPDRLRVTFGLPIQSAKGIAEAMRVVQQEAAWPAGVRATPSGYLPLYVQMMTTLVASQAASFIVAFLVIFVMLGVLLQSVRAALLSLVPNGLPILLTLGLMGWVGIPLDAATVTMAAVVLGLVVDDTVHLLYRYRHERGRQAPRAAFQAALRTTGRAVTATTLVLAAGLSLLGFAAIKSVAWFGLLTAFAMLVAWLADVLVLPALIALSAGYRRRPVPA